MPYYRFTTHDVGEHTVDLELPNDTAARQEARKAFAEAARDALADIDDYQMAMTVETGGRTIYRARIAFNSGDAD